MTQMHETHSAPMSQDGYHTRPKYLGFDEKEHPNWEQLHPQEFRNLFYSWHPGLLGHEMMGMQLAYHFGSALLETLETLADPSVHEPDGTIKKEFLNQLEADATVEPLPSNTACEAKWCNPKFTCASSTTPHYAGSEVSTYQQSDKSKWQIMEAEDLPPIPNIKQVCGGNNKQSDGCFRVSLIIPPTAALASLHPRDNTLCLLDRFVQP